MKPDTSVTYLGLRLCSPFVIGASPLSQEAGDLLALERAGAGAVVMHSLFEEQLSSENSAVAALTEDTEDSFSEASGFFPESCDYTLGPEQYLSHLRALKSKLAIPVIASLNGCTPAAGRVMPGRSNAPAPTRWSSISTNSQATRRFPAVKSSAVSSRSWGRCARQPPCHSR